MATSLQRQLAALAAPSTSILVVERKRSSIIFSPKEAASYDRETFYQIGLEGLKELHEINPKLFQKYFESMIFDDSAKSLERAVMDAETNKMLDDVIDEFLICVSPYMTIKAPLKCMEWLVYRFHIEKFNVESVVRCILPFYDTKAFALVVKVLEVESFQANKNWLWLLPSIKLGVPLTRKDLFGNANVAFISWLFETLDQFMKIHRGNLDTMSTFVAFLTSLILGVLNLCNEDRRGKLGNTKIILKILWKKITKLLVRVQKNAVQVNENLRSAILMIVSMLVMVHKDHPEIAIAVPGSTVMQLMLESCPSELMRQTILLVNFMASHSNWDGLYLKSKEMRLGVLLKISELSNEMDVYPITSLFLKTRASKNHDSCSEIWDVLRDVQLTVNQRAEILKELFYLYNPRNDAGKLKSKPRASEYVTRFEREYPLEFSVACKTDTKFVRDVTDASCNKLSTMSGHPESEIRCEAITKAYRMGKKRLLQRQHAFETASTTSTSDEEEGVDVKTKSKTEANKIKPWNLDTNVCARQIIDRFKDDDPVVLHEMLKPKLGILKQIFTVDTLIEGLCTIVEKNVEFACTRLALKKLCSLIEDVKVEGLEQRNKILKVVYQYLFPRSSNEMQLTSLIVNSPFSKDEKLFAGYTEKLADENLKYKELCQFSYEVISESDKFKLDTAYWADQYKVHKKQIYMLFAAMSARDIDSAILLLDLVDQEHAKVLTSKYPVTKDNFLKVLKASERDRKIPVELVLTYLEKIDFGENKALQQRIFNLAMNLADIEERRETSSVFLRNFLKKNFPRSGQLLDFWTYLIMNPSEDADSTKAEYRLIRTLQFLRSIFFKLSEKSVAGDAKSELPSIPETDSMDELSDVPTSLPRRRRGVSETRDAIVTRRATSETRDTVTPARNTRRSLRSSSQTHLSVIANLPIASPRKRTLTTSSGDGESVSTKNSRVDTDSAHYRHEASGLFLTVLTQCVRNVSEHVRHWGLECLRILLNWQHLEAVWSDLITHMLQYKSELESDKKQLNKVVAKLLSGKGHAKLQKRLLEVATKEEEHETIRIGVLQLMAGTDNASIFESLLPNIKAELEKSASSKLLVAYLNTYDGSVKHIDILKQCLSREGTFKPIVSKFTSVHYDKLPMAAKRLIFVVMIDISARCEVPEVKVGIQRTVRKWMLNTEIVASELEACLSMQKQQCQMGVPPVDNGALKATAKVSNYKRDDSLEWVSRTEAVLEFAQSGKRLVHKTKLIPVLFKLLKICITMEEQSPVEYMKQLILTALTVACEHESDDEFKKNMADWIHFQVDIVIDCLRCSRNPQTHHHALILLNYAAKLFPEQVLHGVMSLFTFMGNSILRQDDSYSTQLIQQTVTTIIPTLAVSGGVQNYNRTRVSAGIYRVFTAAVQDIPTHRRVPIFSSLVNVLDPQESMWQVLLIIIDNALTAPNKRVALKSDMELAENVIWSFEPEIVLRTLEKLYTYLSDLPLYDKRRNEEFSTIQNSQTAINKSIIDLSRKSNIKEVQLVVNFALELVTKVLMRFTNVDTKELNFNIILEKCLVYSKVLAALSEDKTFRAISSRNFEALEKINDVLNPGEFIQSVMFILSSTDTNVKKKVLDMLNQRLLQKLDWFDNLEALLTLLPSLLDSLKQQIENEDAVQFVQTIFLSLKLLARNLAVKSPDNFVSVFEISYEHARSKNSLLSASALLCLSELFCLKSLIIPKLGEITSAILKSFKRLPRLCNSDDVSTEDDVDNEKEETRIEDMQSSTQMLAGNLLLLSGMTTFIKFIEQLGLFAGSSFISKALVALLSIKSEYFGNGEKADNRKKAFETKLKNITKVIASKISLRALLMPLRKAFVKLSSRHESSLPLLMKLLKDSLLGTEKQEYTSLLASVQDAFVLEFLEFRRARVEDYIMDTGANGLDEDSVNVIEDEILDCLVSGVILKLSEASFRPFYHRLYDWAGDNLCRKVTFYRMSSHTAQKLKSLFVNFAAYVIDGASKSLSTDTQLTKAVLKYLSQVFLNDREGFITPERFNNLITPILDLIETEDVISSKILVSEVNATIIQMALATNDLNRWQYLIELISLKAQNEKREVRLFTVALLESVAKELEKDFLPLLPPAVPFLAELLGDDDEGVEAATKKMLVKLEAIVGEPLQPYFSS